MTYENWKNRAQLALRLYPALELALLLVISISIYFRAVYVIIVLGVLFWVLDLRRIILFSGPFLALFLGYLGLYYKEMPPQKETSIQGQIKIESVEFKQSPFGSGILYKGRLSTSEGICRLPIAFQGNKKWQRLDPRWTYFVEGTLLPKEGYGFGLKMSAPPRALKKRLSLVPLRTQLKTDFKRFLKRVFKDPKVRDFYIGVSTGEFSNTFMAYTFARFGLNHLLAISGFHFGLLILFLHFIFSIVGNFKLKNILILIGITSFYLFVGSGPSLSRAWIVAFIYLLGGVLEKRASAINTLSLSLFIILMMDPMMMKHLGFQFSFLVTYGILFFTPYFFRLLQKVMGDKHLLKTWISGALSLGISVHLAALPLSLFVFHKFYWMGFIFNLFVPAIASILLIFFLGACLLYLIYAPLSLLLFQGLSRITEKGLEALFNIPTTWDYCARVPFVPLWLLIVYLIGFFMAGLVLSTQKASGLEENLEFKSLPSKLHF